MKRAVMALVTGAALLGAVADAGAWETVTCVRAVTPRLLPGTPQRIILIGTIGKLEPKVGNTQLNFTVRWDFVYDSFGRPIYTDAPHYENNVAYTQIEMVDCSLSNN